MIPDADHVNHHHHHRLRQLVIATPVCQSKDFFQFTVIYHEGYIYTGCGTAKASKACLDICTAR